MRKNKQKLAMVDGGIKTKFLCVVINNCVIGSGSCGPLGKGCCKEGTESFVAKTQFQDIFS